MVYRRLEISKRYLQEELCNILGVELQDPEVLAKLGQDYGILPQLADYDIEEYYDEYKDELVLVIEGWFRRERRN
jgi:hypothetical protein